MESGRPTLWIPLCATNDILAVDLLPGCSFNRTLWRVTGAQIGREGRAMMNAGNGFSSFWAPVINLAREPRWGRNIEVGLKCSKLSSFALRTPVRILTLSRRWKMRPRILSICPDTWRRPISGA